MLTKEDLLKSSFGQEEVEIPGKGTVTVRSLTRGQALQVQGVEMDAAEMERKLVALAMVDPSLSEDEVKVWQDTSPAGELQPVVEAIVRLSGLEQHAMKETVRKFRD